jgi:hypothetical protein
MSRDRIVAVGLLTQRDLDVLGSDFHRLFPVDEDEAFAALLRELDDVPAVSCASGPRKTTQSK